LPAEFSGFDAMLEYWNGLHWSQRLVSYSFCSTSTPRSRSARTAPITPQWHARWWRLSR
jgi:hypothetical protein